MSLAGHVHNGVIVLDAGAALPEGTRVVVSPLVDESAGIRPGSGDWTAAASAARELRESGYDFDAWRQQREHDLQHALDHLP